MTTAAPTSTSTTITRLDVTAREWLAEQGLAVSLEQARQEGKRPGGRLSNKAKDALADKRAQGFRFADDPQEG